MSNVQDRRKYKADLTGRTFTHLTVISHCFSMNRHKWLCRCVCGRATLAYSYFLLAGTAKSCGCRGTGTTPEYHYRRARFQQ